MSGCQDKGLNDSQIFTINFDDFKVTKLGPLYQEHDLEAIAIDPITGIIYLASGDDSEENKGHLYIVDGQTGELLSVGSTGFNEIEDLAFSPDGTLWAWAKDDGLITIDLTTGIGTLREPYNEPIEGLTLSQDEGHTIFYGSSDTKLLIYDMEAEELKTCPNLLGETEALEMMPDGFLLIGINNDESFNIHTFDAKKCEIIEEADIPTKPFNDIEGIALPIEACFK
ncbi:hypothetical protein QUF74_03440 [Candidatus Halobeggiatoa sp. HSG11]|nr:hypothetical protein [Candidatus Halobeggiatoa sp. HSG11]